MRNYKVYVCSVIFVGLTAVKLLFPSHSDMLRKQVLGIINRDEDYTQMVETLGRNLSEGSLGENLVAVLDLNGGADKTTDGIDVENNLTGPETRPMPAVSETHPAQPEGKQAGEVDMSSDLKATMGEDLPEAVSAFIARQAEFVGYDLPENVRVDIPPIDFEHVSPVMGTDSSGFGFRVHPIQNEVKFHYGTDFAANVGDNVLAFADAYVYAAGTSDGYGNYLILTHGGGFSTVYAHLSEFVAREGDMVSRGQVIGKVGQTGNATGPHLHFEMLLNDIYINPEYYL